MFFNTLRIALLVAVFTLLTGCGIVTLPFQVVGMVVANKPWHVQGQVVDDLGRPVPSVHAMVSKGFWGVDLIYGDLLEGSQGWSSNEEHQLQNGKFSFGGLNLSAQVKFSAPGYHDRLLEILPVSGTPDPRAHWDMSYPSGITAPPLSGVPQLVRLDRKIDPANLKPLFIGFRGDFSQKSEAYDLDKLDPEKTSTTIFAPLPIDDAALPPNCLICIFERAPGLGDFSYRAVTGLRLICTSPGGGLIRVPARNGEPADGMMRTVPESGFARELFISASDFDAATRHINPILFYIKTSNQYGRISLHNGDNPTAITGRLWLAPAGSRNVE